MTESPLGRRAVRTLSLRSTTGWAMEGETGIEAGLCLRSIAKRSAGWKMGFVKGLGMDEDSLTREARKVVLRAGSIWKRQGVFCELRVAQWL